VDRRSVLKSALLALAAKRVAFADWIGAAQAQQQEKDWRHGLSLYGDLKYAPGFKHFEYVNPNAPKSGTVRQIALGTFDNFNIVVSGVKGVLAVGIGFIYDRLSVPSLDEAGSEYGLLAEAISCAADFSSASYRLRADAKWNDGVPVTSDDVIFSFEAFRKYSPQESAYYRHVVSVEKTGDRELTFTFDGPGDRELPQIVGGLVVLPKHWWEGINADGNKRDIGATTLEAPLGSGPYRIKEFSPGRNIVYERVKSYWGRAVNVNIGANNFDELWYEYDRCARGVQGRRG
jgi:microcin C transport system substrate-binding protein